MINLIISAVMLATPNVVYEDEGCDWDSASLYEDLVEIAIEECSVKPERETILWELVEVEQLYGLPYELHGLLLAAACSESRFNPNAKGDWRVNKRGRKVARAIGLFQMWRWWERAYDVDRRSTYGAAIAYMKHISRQLPKVEKQCRFKTDERQWIAAWVTAIRAPKRGGRCYEKPNHLRRLKRWHRKAKKIQEERFNDEWNEEEGDGC